MGRSHSYVDRAFNRPDYDAEDQGTFDRNLVFVGMRMDAEADAIFAAISRACGGLGLHAKRVDDMSGSGIVLQEVADLIERAEFLVFDLSQERPNVYYELGYAHGVGNESDDILIVAREGTRIHFDVAPIRIHFYSDHQQLNEIAHRNLESMIRRTRRD